MNKKFLILLLILVLIVSFFAVHKSIANTEISQDNIKKIEEEEKDCINKNFETDYDMMQCSIIAMEKYSLEIEKVLKSSKKLFSKEQYEQMLKAQAKWEEFMEENNLLLEMTYEKDCPPYLPCLTAQGEKSDYTKNRAVELIGFYNIYKLFQEKGIPVD